MHEDPTHDLYVVTYTLPPDPEYGDRSTTRVHLLANTNRWTHAEVMTHLTAQYDTCTRHIRDFQVRPVESVADFRIDALRW